MCDKYNPAEKQGVGLHGHPGHPGPVRILPRRAEIEANVPIGRSHYCYNLSWGSGLGAMTLRRMSRGRRDDRKEADQ